MHLATCKLPKKRKSHVRLRGGRRLNRTSNYTHFSLSHTHHTPAQPAPGPVGPDAKPQAARPGRQGEAGGEVGRLQERAAQAQLSVRLEACVDANRVASGSALCDSPRAARACACADEERSSRACAYAPPRSISSAPNAPPRSTLPARPHTQLSTAAVALAQPLDSCRVKGGHQNITRHIPFFCFRATRPAHVPVGSFARRAPMPLPVKLPHTPSALLSRRCP